MKNLALLLTCFVSFSQAKDYNILPSQDPQVFLKNATSPSVQRALKLKMELDQKNQQDLRGLIDTSTKLLNSYSSQKQGEIIENALSELQKDKETLKAIQSIVAATKFDSIRYSTFKSSLAKMSADNGYFDDAAKVLNAIKLNSTTQINLNSYKKVPQEEQVGVKIALIYLSHLDHSGRANRIQNLKMRYSASVPTEVNIPEDKLNDWFVRTEGGLSFQVINVGFVFGGEFQNGICYGIDCSSFVSFVTSSRDRLSTMVMEYTARELGAGIPLQSAVELKLKEEFLVNWGMYRALQEYSAISLQDTRDLKEGDVVVWRWTPTGKKYRTGHAVLVIKTTDSDHFIALECNREDDKSLEGVVLTERILKKESSDIYVLRRK